MKGSDFLKKYLSRNWHTILVMFWGFFLVSKRSSELLLFLESSDRDLLMRFFWCGISVLLFLYFVIDLFILVFNKILLKFRSEKNVNSKS